MDQIKYEGRCRHQTRMLKTSEATCRCPDQKHHNKPVAFDFEVCQCVLPHNHPGCHIVEFEGQRWPVDR